MSSTTETTTSTNEEETTSEPLTIAYDENLKNVIIEWLEMNIDSFELDKGNKQELIDSLFYIFVGNINMFQKEIHDDSDDEEETKHEFKLYISDYIADGKIKELVEDVIHGENHERFKQTIESHYKEAYLDYLETKIPYSLVKLIRNDYLEELDNFYNHYERIIDKMIESYTSRLQPFIDSLSPFVELVNKFNITNKLDMNKIKYTAYNSYIKETKTYIDVFNLYNQLLGIDKIRAILKQFKIIDFDVSMFHYCSTCSSSWDPNEVPGEFEDMNSDCKAVQIDINERDLEYTKENHDSLDNLFTRQKERFELENSKSSYRLIQNIIQIITSTDDSYKKLEPVKLYAYERSCSYKPVLYEIDGYDDRIAEEEWFNNLITFFNNLLPGFFILIERYLYERMPRFDNSRETEKIILKERDLIRKQTGFDALTLEYDEEFMKEDMPPDSLTTSKTTSKKRVKKAKIIYVYSSDDENNDYNDIDDF